MTTEQAVERQAARECMQQDLIRIIEDLLCDITTPGEVWCKGSSVERARAAVKRAKEQQ